MLRISLHGISTSHPTAEDFLPAAATWRPVCHGAKGEGVIGDRLIGGRGTLTSANPLRTVGSYWPYATTLFDYIRRAMPYNAPQSLSADEVYALSAWILNQNGIVPDDARLDAHSLAAIRMPNRDGFVPDPRPGKL
jgi:cytochrome c